MQLRCQGLWFEVGACFHTVVNNTAFGVNLGSVGIFRCAVALAGRNRIQELDHRIRFLY